MEMQLQENSYFKITTTTLGSIDNEIIFVVAP